MEYSGRLGGGSPLMMKFQIDSTIANRGVPLTQPVDADAGLVIGTTTNIDNMVGVNLDTATYVTAQQTDGTSAARRVTVIINPDAIWKARLSGAAAEGTALTFRDVTTASTDGLAVTTGDDWTSPTMDEGVVWGYDGPNAGAFRKITSVSVTAATVTVAFDRDTVVGDNFLYAPIWPMENHTVTLTTNLQEVRQDAAVSVITAALVCINVELKDLGGEGTRKSYGYFVSGNHILGAIAN